MAKSETKEIKTAPALKDEDRAMLARMMSDDEIGAVDSFAEMGLDGFVVQKRVSLIEGRWYKRVFMSRGQDAEITTDERTNIVPTLLFHDFDMPSLRYEILGA